MVPAYVCQVNRAGSGRQLGKAEPPCDKKQAKSGGQQLERTAAEARLSA
jgi:hypothetical protein